MEFKEFNKNMAKSAVQTRIVTTIDIAERMNKKVEWYEIYKK